MLGAAVVVSLLVGEGAVRLVAPQQLIQLRPDIWAPADSLGWVNRPGVHTTINTGERTVHVYTDQDGLRIAGAGRPRAASNVLVIGDSFMEALQVEYEQSFSGLLEAGLTRRLGHPVAVWDAGVDGWDPPQYLIRARQLLNTHPFNLVIVGLYLGNDVVTERRHYFPPRAPQVRHRLRFPRALRWSAWVDALLYPINDVLKRHSELFMLAKNQLQTLRQRLGLTADYFPIVMRRREATSSRWAITARICQDIAQAAQAHGAPTVFVLVPDPLAVDTALFRSYTRGFHVDPATVDTHQPDRLMDEALRALDLRAVSVQAAFEQRHARGAELYGKVDRHLSPGGNAALAQLILPVAARLLTADQRGVGQAQPHSRPGRHDLATVARSASARPVGLSGRR